ncbi:MAG: CDP-glycerol glycerophosphotransferase family protein [Oscillospiraceae bacterium]|nr:CDP-glycerol glycerophosphotransferase family protein [Oscillospiraceae bacterium]
MNKEQFKYAKLYNSENGTYCTDFSEDNLCMGPETQKRFDANDEDVAVTVCCITYNHEDYIRQALDGFVMQKTNFKFKVFVGEDKGTDSTADIIREYAEKYPDIIVPFIRRKNMGAQTNLIDLCNHANSPYIAFCEGDDFWVDEYKLQKQFDYMQSHEDVRMCYTSTEILAPKDWHLNSYYKSDKNGKRIIPFCTPGFKRKDYYTLKDFLIVFPNHTSSAFYRWNYDLDIPEWYFRGIIGDIPITLMQMGKGKAVYLPDVTSVYRRSDVGIFMSHSNQEHFANTRLDYVRFISGLRAHFREYYGGICDGLFRYRTTKEIHNYLNVAKQYKNTKMVTELFKTYPNEAFEAMHSFLGSYNIYSSLQGKLKNNDIYHLYRTRRAVFFVLPGLKLYSLLSGSRMKCKKALARIKDNIKNRMARFKKAMARIRDDIKCWRGYWKYTKVPKEKNLWVFSGFRHNTYMDNTMYFYEYIIKNHPEINAVWLTTNEDIYNRLREEGKNVKMMNSPEGTNILSRAEVAVTDHFVTTDFSPIYGYNDKTKVVQLWHGVGFKSMGDANGVKNTTERGVKHSSDILVKEGDGAFTRLKKKIKYFFLAPFRELFERYFLFVCPGQERLDMIADVWHIPHENCFMAGHSRDLPVYSSERQESPIKIMYAPTYRFNYKRECQMVIEFLESTKALQKLMEKIDGVFYLRMHPHTWRNYSVKIKSTLENYDRIFLDEEKDIYQSIGTFSIVISDYSSIALDFALLDRPVIFHCPDYDWFVENEAGFNLDFPAVIPGPMTDSWKETIKKIREYSKNPGKDAKLREEKLKYFFDNSVNGPDNSKRIVEEIKNRLGL